MRNINRERLGRVSRHGGRDARAMRQHGIAIVTVLLVVALAATLIAGVVWRELVAVRDVENQRLNLETLWVERAAVEWARATLIAQSATSNVVYVGQGWSAPVADIQLANFLPRDALAANGDLAAAYISGEVEDAQAKFNLMDLVSRGGPKQPWQIDGPGVQGYQRLLEGLSLNPGLAQSTAAYILRSLRDGNGSGDWPLQPVSERDLARISGYSTEMVKDLSSYVTVLPDYTTVNANTAEEAVLTAAIPSLSAEQAHSLVTRRSSAYFIGTGDLALVLTPTLTTAQLPAGSIVGVNSGYFIVHCRIHSVKLNTRIDTLIGRYGIGSTTWTKVVWVHRLAL